MLSSTTTSTTTPTTVIIPAATIAVSPRLGSRGISPRTAITIQADHGTLADVVMRGTDGTVVKGSLSTDRRTWRLGEPLGYDATYDVTGKAVAANGKITALKGSYSTVSPDNVISASISPGDGDTVGIGAPILISLGTDIVDTVGRQNIEKAITVTTVPKTEGSFAWIQHDDGWGLDWRPKSYWAPGTKVTVKADLYGVSYGGNLWGKEDLTSSFTIGRAEITKGDISTHRLKVYRDGKLVFDFPTSFGLESDPGRVTRGGTYIVMGKEYLHLMSNPAYHYFNFKAYYAVRISNNGTFIHANDGTADIQGYENVTHGCANLTMTNAKAFYDQTLYGDPVEITNSSIPMSQSDGDIYDWSIPWSKWQTLSALSESYAYAS
ncbi:L,D-transpeptidase [Nakamurella panacisegetis]|uniref:L,D-transpeptidase n=1 Tax=Nakamurella panacisegetis TaxID=1090615 RepID=UPI000B865A24|nr:Ig-like domain-containing protein [Nakamurella panacisegetis]